MPLISEAGLREQLLAYLDRRVAAPEEELLAQLAQRTGATLEALRERLRRICLELVADGLLERSGPDQWRAVRLRDAAESPDEVLPGSAPYYSEQASVAVRANKYERDRNARRQCIEHYGARCLVCGFDFESGYGALGRGCVRVHHVVPPAQLGPGYRLDPVRDLRPVCANCHYMLHRADPPWSVEQLRGLVRRCQAGVEREALSPSVAIRPS